MTLLVPGSMSMETRISPDDLKDFYSSLKKNPLSTVANPIKIELSGFSEEKNTENFQELNAYSIIKKFFLNSTRAFRRALLSKEFFLWEAEFCPQ